MLAVSSTEALRPPRRTQAERRSTTRRLLLDAAFASLLDDGALAMTLGEVAARAGVTTGALQRHFGTKTGLLLAVFEEIGERRLHRLANTQFAGRSDMEGGLRAALLATWDGRDLQDARVAADIAHVARADFELYEALLAQYTRIHAEWAMALARHIDPAIVQHPQYDTALSLILVMMRGLTSPPAPLNTDAEIREFLGRVADLLEVALTAGAGSRQADRTE